MKLKNKWTGRLYDLLKDTGANVTLRRDDGYTFTIQKGELYFNYRILR